MSNSIKIDLYSAVKSAIEGILESGAGSPALFKFVGHYNSPETETENNFAYRTPAAFISLQRIDWTSTQFDTPSADLSREQKGLVTVSIHLFFHDLRTDTDSYIEHLQKVNQVYRTLIGLRSDSSVEGKFSSLRRIVETDDMIFKNLRHWVQTYESFVQEAPISSDLIDVTPATLKYTIDVVKP